MNLRIYEGRDVGDNNKRILLIKKLEGGSIFCMKDVIACLRATGNGIEDTE